MRLCRVRINEKLELVMRVDTGSDRSVLSINEYKKARASHPGILPDLQPSDIRMTAANSSSMHLVGCVDVEISTVRKTIYERVYVQSSPMRYPLLGESALIDLDIVMYDDVTSYDVNNLNTDFDPFKYVPPALQAQIDVINAKYSSVFDGRIGHYKNGQFKAEYLVDESIFRTKIHRPRPCSPHLRDKFRKKLEELEKEGIIERCLDSHRIRYASPAHPIAKGDSIRLCIDQRGLNSFLVRCGHASPPRFEDFVDLLRDKPWRGKLDLKDSFFSIELSQASKELNNFCTPWGLYRLRRLSQGSKVSKDILECVLIDVFANDLTNVRLGYDDILFAGSTEKELLKVYDRILYLLQKNNLKCNPQKVIVGVKALKFWGYEFLPRNYRADSKRVDTIRKTSYPSTPAGLLSWLCLATFDSKFLPTFSNKAAILQDLARKKNEEFIWTDAHRSAFDSIRNDLCRRTLLEYYDPTRATIIYCDAGLNTFEELGADKSKPPLSGGYGALMCQVDPERGLLPIHFASRRLSRAETKLDQVSLEVRAVIFGLLKFERYYAHSGQPVIIRSDSRASCSILSKPTFSAPPRLIKAALSVQHLDFRMEFVKGNLNKADLLSRSVWKDENDDSIDYDRIFSDMEQIQICNVDYIPQTVIDRLVPATAADPQLVFLKDCIENNSFQTHRRDPMMGIYFDIRFQLSTQNGLLYKGDQIIVPTECQDRLLQTIHNISHGGEHSTAKLFLSTYWFHGLYPRLKKIVAACSKCAVLRPDHTKYTGESHSYASEPLQYLHLDFKSNSFGTPYYMVLEDNHSKMVWAIGLHNLTSATVEKELQEFFDMFGIPKTIKSDAGPPLQSNSFREFCRRHRIHHKFSVPRHPQSNALIEATMKIIKHAVNLAKLEKSEQHESYVRRALFSYRNCPHSTTQNTPFKMFFGRSNNIATLLPVEHRDFDENRELAAKRKERHEIIDRQQAIIDRFNEGRKSHSFRIGDLVLVAPNADNVYEEEKYRITSVEDNKIVSTRCSDNRLMIRDASCYKALNSPDELGSNVVPFEIGTGSSLEEIQRLTTAPARDVTNDRAVPDTATDVETTRRRHLQESSSDSSSQR